MQSEAHMEAWRAAIDQRFSAFLDELYEQRLKKFYAVAKTNEPTRPIVEQAFRQVLDDLFDPAHYPNGMDHEAVMARAQGEFATQLHDILSPQWEALMLEGKRNHYKNARSWSYTTLVDECVHQSEYLLQAMDDEGKRLTRETAQRLRLPMGAEALRDACVREGETVISVVLEGLEPFYAVTEQNKLTLHLALENAVDDAIAAAKDDEGGLHRAALVTEILDENFSRKMSEALTQQHAVLDPKRAGIAPKDLGAVVGLGRVQGELRRSVARSVNRAFVDEATPDAAPTARVAKASVEHQGAVDYGKVPFMHGNDMLSRDWVLTDRLRVLIAGDEKLMPLADDIFKAVRAAMPPIGRSKVKTVKHYFTWLEKESAVVLEAKLAGIEGLGAPERELLLEAHRVALPDMLKEAQANGDYLAGEMDKRGMKWR